MLPGHHPQPHDLCLRGHAGAAHPHLPLGHAVGAPAQQALLDDGHRLHGGVASQIERSSLHEALWVKIMYRVLVTCANALAIAITVNYAELVLYNYITVLQQGHLPIKCNQVLDCNIS